jgi:hypothetical protein
MTVRRIDHDDETRSTRFSPGAGLTLSAGTGMLSRAKAIEVKSKDLLCQQKPTPT